MNILYYGFIREDVSLPIIFCVAAFIICAAGIFVCESVSGKAIAGLFLLMSSWAFYELMKCDFRVPIIKTTINDSISYHEINDRYKLISQEGEIYTFKVLNTAPEEWEQVIKDQENKDAKTN